MAEVKRRQSGRTFLMTVPTTLMERNEHPYKLPRITRPEDTTIPPRPTAPGDPDHRHVPILGLSKFGPPTFIGRPKRSPMQWTRPPREDKYITKVPLEPEPSPVMPSLTSTWTSLPNSLLGSDSCSSTRGPRTALALNKSRKKKKPRFGSTGLDSPCLPLQMGGLPDGDTFALTWSGLTQPPSRQGTPVGFPYPEDPIEVEEA